VADTARSILLGPWCGGSGDAAAGLSWLQVALEEVSGGGLALMDVARPDTPRVPGAFASWWHSGSFGGENIWPNRNENFSEM